MLSFKQKGCVVLLGARVCKSVDVLEKILVMGMRIDVA